MASFVFAASIRREAGVSTPAYASRSNVGFSPRTRSSDLELHVRHLSRRGAGSKISVVLLESGDSRPDVIRKLKNERVVVLNRVVIPFARHANAVLGPGQL